MGRNLYMTKKMARVNRNASNLAPTSAAPSIERSIPRRMGKMAVAPIDRRNKMPVPKAIDRSRSFLI